MKIDISKISGFESMSPEEQIEALKNFEIGTVEDKTKEIERLKELNSKYSSEIAEFKRKEKERLSEDERAKVEMEEKFSAMEKNYNELLAKTQLDSYTAQFKAQGYDDDLAKETADAMLNGRFETVISNQLKFKESLEKKIKADVMKGTAHPDDKGKGAKVTTKEDLKKMSEAERFSFAKANPEEYQRIYKGE